MRAAVAWSWDLLSDGEQAALRRLSVFAGDADVAGATQVCAVAGVPYVLDSLVDKSLLSVAGGRYRMLETVAAYADERLAEAGESEATRRAHAEYLLSLARTADPRLRTVEQLAWLRILGDEHENLLAALRWAVGAGRRHCRCAWWPRRRRTSGCAAPSDSPPSTRPPPWTSWRTVRHRAWKTSTCSACWRRHTLRCALASDTSRPRWRSRWRRVECRTH
ncbi:hypothetical protein ACFQ1L_17215 [Phytohabitans flavus]|uniref:hypothetical protein n=1 Tax=Phytohabitans flavus TaxID=1076124 RepID=UPI00362C2A9E